MVGALAVAEHARALGTPSVLGGVSWERRPIDPLPGPRRLDEVEGARQLNDATALVGPGTHGPGGFAFAEARMAGVLKEAIALYSGAGFRPIARAHMASRCDQAFALDL